MTGSPGSAVEEITRLLGEWRAGSSQAQEALFPLVYGQLRAIAGHLMRGERRGHTLEPGALVHEAYLRLAAQDRSRWKSRGHFFALAARMMRRVLLDHARGKRTAKRRHLRADLEAAADLPAPRGDRDLRELVAELAAAEPRLAAVVELRFFAGLTLAETATVLGRSRRAVVGDWSAARSWLDARLDPGADGG